MKQGGHEGWSDFEKKLAAAMKAEQGEWTADYVEPDDLIDLIEQGGEYSNALKLQSHIVGCAYCRHQYGDMRKTLELARRAREIQEDAEPKTTCRCGAIHAITEACPA